MQRLSFFFLGALCTVSFFITSCQRSQQQVWDDSQTCGHYMARGVRSLGGKQGDSRQIHSKEDFEGNRYCQEDFISLLEEESDEVEIAELTPPSPKEVPGLKGGKIPGIQAFRDPATISEVADLIKTIHFDFDSSMIKGDKNLKSTRMIAEYLKKHPNCYLFIEGHCDDRGPEAYNLSLGARRSNTIRNFLIKEGANPDHLFTVSYGKERPLVMGNNEKAWAQNRRGEFKVYYK